jgi:hypothetical protein
MEPLHTLFILNGTVTPVIKIFSLKFHIKAFIKKERLKCDGNQFHQYQQSEQLYMLSFIFVIEF